MEANHVCLEPEERIDIMKLYIYSRVQMGIQKRFRQSRGSESTTHSGAGAQCSTAEPGLEHHTKELKI